MKLLVASTVGQGERANDYSWCIEGELVMTGFVCATDRKNPDGGCGCGRGFAGMASQRATTTAVVSEMDISPQEFAATVRHALHTSGWLPSADRQADDELVVAFAEQVMRAAAPWPVGTVMRRRLDDIRPA
ncbi:MAG: hypothetical protein QOC55_2621 [Thermoleophilaceae bacterium]|nr:hypothetical protein [Thermoleophilaceae bacterium]